MNIGYTRFRILKLERLLIPTIKEEIDRCRHDPDVERYRLQYHHFLLELEERKNTLRLYRWRKRICR